jgi:hypothetical protein
MSGRGQENDPGGRRRWAGRCRGRGSPPRAREAKFKKNGPTLPTLNYGAGPKENRPIEFLQLFGEYCAINYNESIALAFRTSPPEFRANESEPEMPDPIPNKPSSQTTQTTEKNGSHTRTEIHAVVSLGCRPPSGQLVSTPK